MNIRVLIAEDDGNSRLLLKTLLESQGCEVLSASNGLEAWKLLEQHTPQLIISDIMMPEMNGYEATRKIKAIYPDLPIIGQTALAMEGDKALILKSGCDDYMSKPIQIPPLKSLVIKHLSHA